MNESFIIANRTDVGVARDVNEDSMVTFDSPNGRVVAVCDGMGGQAAGDVASKLACDIITDILSNNTFSTPTEAITRACLAANQGILHAASQHPEYEGMGATCVMVIIKNGLVYYGWVGDSRIYYIDNGVVRQISRDQSFVQQLVDSGQITAAEAENHPQKNEITNALGLATMTPPELCATPLSPVPGSVVLLCSDGLSGMVDNHIIGEVASDQSLPLQKRAEKLVDIANANGGQDNITVQLIEFGKSAAPAAARQAGKINTGTKKNKGAGWVWFTVLASVVIIGVLLVFMFMGDNPEPGKTKSQDKDTKATNTEVFDTRENKDAETTNVRREVKNTTVTVTKEDKGSRGSSSGNNSSKKKNDSLKDAVNKSIDKNNGSGKDDASKLLKPNNKGNDFDRVKNDKKEKEKENNNLTDKKEKILDL